MAQDRLIQNADGSVTLVYANGARQTVPASNRAGLLQLAERVPAEQIEAPVLERIRSIDPQAVPKTSAELRTDRVSTLRTELENQYNNLVKADPRLTYAGRQSDLPAIFNQQAQQLADAGVTSVANLRNQDGRLVDSATGKPVNTTNLGGQIAIDRDTGAQKFGDIFSGVQGGANYGIQFAPDGTPILFPVHEKSKSLYQQVVGSDLFKVASLALAAYGVYNLATAGAAGAAAGGSAAAADAATSGLSLLADDAAFIAADAAQLAGQGLSSSQITQTLISTGVSPSIAGSAASLASSGIAAGDIASNIITSASPGTTNLFTATPADFTAAGITTGGTGVPVTEAQLKAIQEGKVGGSTFAEQVANAQALLPAESLLDDALSYGSRLGGLLGGPQQQGLVGGGGGMVGGRPAGGVDYSELLKSLTRQASVPGVASLIGPVVQPAPSLLSMQVQPVQYQSLLNQQSLLG